MTVVSNNNYHGPSLHTHCLCVTTTLGRDRQIWTVLRPSQTAGFNCALMEINHNVNYLQTLLEINEAFLVKFINYQRHQYIHLQYNCQL